MFEIPKLYVVQIEQIGPKYFELLKTLLFPLLIESESNKSMDIGQTLLMQTIQQRILQVYQESIRQIFDCMTSDFADFLIKLSTLPRWDLFLDYNIIIQNSHVEQGIREGIKEFGTGIYFCLLNQGAFSFNANIILDQPAMDHLVLNLVRD